MPDVLGIVLFLLFGAVAGWLAGLLVQGYGFGLFGNMVIGIIGAVIGGTLFSFLGIEAGGLLGSLIAAVVGAAILLFIVGLFRRGPGVASS